MATDVNVKNLPQPSVVILSSSPSASSGRVKLPRFDEELLSDNPDILKQQLINLERFERGVTGGLLKVGGKSVDEAVSLLGGESETEELKAEMSQLNNDRLRLESLAKSAMASERSARADLAYEKDKTASLRLQLSLATQGQHAALYKLRLAAEKEALRQQYQHRLDRAEREKKDAEASLRFRRRHDVDGDVEEALVEEIKKLKSEKQAMGIRLSTATQCEDKRGTTARKQKREMMEQAKEITTLREKLAVAEHELGFLRPFAEIPAVSDYAPFLAPDSSFPAYPSYAPSSAAAPAGSSHGQETGRLSNSGVEPAFSGHQAVSPFSAAPVFPSLSSTAQSSLMREDNRPIPFFPPRHPSPPSSVRPATSSPVLPRTASAPPLTSSQEANEDTSTPLLAGAPSLVTAPAPTQGFLPPVQQPQQASSVAPAQTGHAAMPQAFESFNNVGEPVLYGGWEPQGGVASRDDSPQFPLPFFSTAPLLPQSSASPVIDPQASTSQAIELNPLAAFGLSGPLPPLPGAGSVSGMGKKRKASGGSSKVGDEEDKGDDAVQGRVAKKKQKRPKAVRPDGRGGTRRPKPEYRQLAFDVLQEYETRRMLSVSLRARKTSSTGDQVIFITRKSALLGFELDEQVFPPTRTADTSLPGGKIEQWSNLVERVRKNVAEGSLVLVPLAHGQARVQLHVPEGVFTLAVESKAASVLSKVESVLAEEGPSGTWYAVQEGKGNWQARRCSELPRSAYELLDTGVGRASLARGKGKAKAAGGVEGK
ncbi:hypothetical protein JCM8097_003832 [Rhodosporidiobolus ruineniae]